LSIKKSAFLQFGFDGSRYSCIADNESQVNRIMRVALSFLLVTVFSVACGISTQNSDSLSVKSIELVELNVRQNGEALYELGYFGDEEVATIKKAGKISSTERA
jgi:hypothetical protein